MLSKADSVPGQGVASAYLEQTGLVNSLNDFEIEINSRKNNFDIFHIHSVNLRYRLRMNKKHTNIVYVHFIPKDNEGSLCLPKPLSFIFDKYVNSFYRAADELVVVNPYFIKSLEELGIPKDKITYIPNYVDGTNFYPLKQDEINSLKKEYGVPLDKFVVLGCGQIQTRKGFDDFVEVAKNNPDLFFTWVGGFSFGCITDGYRKYKKMLKKLPKNMIHIDIVPRNKMNEIFNLSDVLFMPSFLELFPMSILEAAQVEKPILLRDLELYHPILFNKYIYGKDVDEFGKELRRLSNDKEYYKLYQDKDIEINKLYSKEKLSIEWRKYYQRIYEKYHD